MNETERLQPREPASNDFVWPPPQRDTEGDILWLDSDPKPTPASPVPASPSISSSPARSAARTLLDRLVPAIRPLKNRVAAPPVITTPLPTLAEPAVPVATRPVPAGDIPAFKPTATASANLPISDLVSRAVRVEWPEVVALVQELGDGLRNSGPSRSLLTLDTVALGPDGRLHADFEPGTVPIVRSLGHVLSQLLASHPGPANLRLIALQADSAASTFSSVDELTSALAIFERPGRLKALAALYERARAAGPAARPVAVAPKPEFRPAPTDTSPRPKADAELENEGTLGLPLQERRKRQRMAVFGVAAVCFAVTAVAVALRALPGTVSAPSSAVQERQPSPVPTGGVTEPETRGLKPPVGRSAVRSGNAPARAQRPVMPTSEAVSATPAAAAAASVAPPVGSPGTQQISPLAEREFVRARTLFDRRQFADAAAGFQRVIDILSNGELSPSSSTLRSTATELAALSLAAVSSPDQRIYSRIDAGVTEPVPMQKFLPREAPAGTAPGDLSVLELIIDSRGFVESVRLQDPQNRYRDRWWLNAAKTWRFQPATKDGQPVKFLKRIPIAAF